MYGELIPVGGGDPIPLLKKSLRVGRRESCDIVLRFPNVSAHHCQLTLDGGYWYIKDLNSRNGVKVNNLRVTEKRVDPGDIIRVARQKYEIQYSPAELGAVGPPPPENQSSDIFSRSLLDRAGLERIESDDVPSRQGTRSSRYDVMDDDDEGPNRDRNEPI